jgi:hypothetical protein
MRTAGIFFVAAVAVVCSGQEPARQAVGRGVALAGRKGALQIASAVPQPGARVDFAGVAKIETVLEQRLKSLNPSDPIDLLGACSGVYLDGYGLVFTAPISLVIEQTFSPFNGGYTPQKAEAIHKRKLAQLPLLTKAANDMLVQAAKAATELPPDEKIALAIRFFYLDYEDTKGLPREIVVSADRASALAGRVLQEERE